MGTRNPPDAGPHGHADHWLVPVTGPISTAAPTTRRFAGEQLAGVSKSSDLAVQWVGRPGPRYQPDRNGRKPSPLSTAGRLFLQGLHRLVAVDAFNGSILWSLEIPDLERFNMPRDCGNWCADRDFVYAAIRDRLWQIDAGTGRVVKQWAVPEPEGRTGPWDGGLHRPHREQNHRHRCPPRDVVDQFLGRSGRRLVRRPQR
ncbi:MAG: hypothetical protein CM1200mP2_58450 [Planctomycetaceae bacterium]|nr:MAG: hypothetical protein CM1200mP2_58450 [Planctomycetaceae bacterium]